MSAPIHPTACAPNFLGIGMQKTGTTWLYAALRRHPQVQLPPRKELRHLMEIAKGEVQGTPCEIPLFQQMRADYDRRFWLRNARRLVTGRWDLADWRWEWRHRRAGALDKAWYLSQFEGSRALVRGEISPQYHQLDAQEVHEVARLLPGVRVVLLLRHPIDQIWSQARMVLAREQGRAPEAVPFDEYRDFFDHWRKRHANYTEIIDRWAGACGRERLFVGFYDELVADPVGLYGRICDFLEVERRSDAQLRTPVNAGGAAPLPEPLRRELAYQWGECVRALVARYPALDPWFEALDF